MQKKRIIIAAVILIILLALCGVMAAVGVVTFMNFKPSSAQVWGNLELDLAKFKAQEEQEKDFIIKDHAVLDISQPFGNIEILPGSQDKIHVHAKKTAYGFNQQDADRELAELVIEMNQEDDKVTIRIAEPDGTLNTDIKPKSVDFIITVPVNTQVIASSDMGDVSLTGTTGNAELRSAFGSVKAAEVTGGLIGKSNNGNVTALSIHAGNEKIDLESDFGNTNLEKSEAGSISAQTDNGKVSLQNVNSNDTIALKSSFGSIEFANGKGSSLKSQTDNGSIHLTEIEIKNEIVATSSFGKVDLDTVKAQSINAKSNNGDVTLNSPQGAIKAQSDFGSIKITGAEDASLDLHTDNGNILFEGSLANGPHNINSNFGNVTLKIPATTQLDVDFKTDFGTVKTDFEITFQGQGHEENHITGKIGNGGELLKVQSNNGSINLEIAK